LAKGLFHLSKPLFDAVGHDVRVVLEGDLLLLVLHGTNAGLGVVREVRLLGLLLYDIFDGETTVLVEH